MDSHSKSYEQYCSVIQKNVAMVETTFHDGKKVISCTMYPQCEECKNAILKNSLKISKTPD